MGCHGWAYCIIRAWPTGKSGRQGARFKSSFPFEKYDCERHNVEFIIREIQCNCSGYVFRDLDRIVLFGLTRSQASKLLKTSSLFPYHPNSFWLAIRVIIHQIYDMIRFDLWTLFLHKSWYSMCIFPGSWVCFTRSREQSLSGRNFAREWFNRIWHVIHGFIVVVWDISSHLVIVRTWDKLVVPIPRWLASIGLQRKQPVCWPIWGEKI